MKPMFSMLSVILALSIGCAAKVPPRVEIRGSLAGNYQLVCIIFADAEKKETILMEGELELNEEGGFSLQVADPEEKEKVFIDGTFVVVGKKLKIDMVFLNGRRLLLEKGGELLFDAAFRREGLDLYLDLTIADIKLVFKKK